MRKTTVGGKFPVEEEDAIIHETFPINSIAFAQNKMNVLPKESSVTTMSRDDRPKTASGPRPASGVLHSRALAGSPTIAGVASENIPDDIDHTPGARNDDNEATLRPSTAVGRTMTASSQRRSSARAGSHRPQTGLGFTGDETRPLSEHTHWHTRSELHQDSVRRSTVISERQSTRPSTSRSGVGSARPLTGSREPVQLVARPITQQGVAAQRTGVASGRTRVVQDRSYFLGVLRTKMSELRSETAKLNRENEELQQQRTTSMTYESCAKELAEELVGMQNELADYNVMVEMINMDSDVAQIEYEYQECRKNNDQEAAAVEKLFLNRKEKDAQLESVTTQLKKEQQQTDALANNMTPEMRQEYEQLRLLHQEYQQQIDELQETLEKEQSRQSQLENEVSTSTIKREAVNLYNHMYILEQKIAQLTEEINAKETPEKERERLLKQVKNDNREISVIESNANEIKKKIARAKDELRALDDYQENGDSEMNMKYRELKKREEVMEEFLLNYEATMNKLEAEIESTEKDISIKLEKNRIYTENASKVASITTNNLNEIHESLKINDLSASNQSTSEAKETCKQLKEHLQQIETLDMKVRNELEDLTKKMARMKEEMPMLLDLEGLKHQHQQKYRSLSRRKSELVKEKEELANQIAKAEAEHASTMQTMDSLEAYSQIKALENRLSSIEQSNYALKEQIYVKKHESDISVVKQKALEAIRDENVRLQKEAGTGKMRLQISSA